MSYKRIIYVHVNRLKLNIVGFFVLLNKFCFVIYVVVLISMKLVISLLPFSKPSIISNDHLIELVAIAYPVSRSTLFF